MKNKNKKKKEYEKYSFVGAEESQIKNGSLSFLWERNDIFALKFWKLNTNGLWLLKGMQKGFSEEAKNGKAGTT